MAPKKTYNWTCGCNAMEFEMTSDPYMALSCMCDDCHVRIKVAMLKEENPGTFNKLGADGGFHILAWHGARVKCTKGEEKMGFYRSAIKNKGTAVNDNAGTLNCHCQDCCTFAFANFNSIGFNASRFEESVVFPPCSTTMASYCAVTGVERPQSASNYIPVGLCLTKIFPMICCCCFMSGSGQKPYFMSCPKGVKEFCGRPVECIGIDAIKALPFPVVKSNVAAKLGT